MAKDIFSKKRLGSLGLILLSTLVLCVVTSIRCGMGLDDAFCLVFLVVIFFPVLAFELEYERIHGFLSDNPQSSLFRVAVGYSAGSVITAVFLFLPVFCRPVILLTIVMCALSNTRIALTCSLFWCIFPGMTDPENVLELAGNMMLVLVGSMLCITLREKKYRFYVSILCFMVTVMIPGVFCYLYRQHFTYTYLIYLVVVGILAWSEVYLVFGSVYEETRFEVKRSYDRLVDKDYPRVKELKDFSPIEYRHARSVFRLAKACGEHIHIDSALCGAAGFYYRMGRWVGKPYVQNGVKRAGQLCFPPQLQEILAEFWGEEKPISTKESALVHMVDAVILKAEVMDAQMGESSWNRKMLVNQTLDEYSVAGLYDASGMSINEFLRTREFISDWLGEQTGRKQEEK